MPRPTPLKGKERIENKGLDLTDKSVTDRETDIESEFSKFFIKPSSHQRDVERLVFTQDIGVPIMEGVHLYQSQVGFRVMSFSKIMIFF